MNNSTKRHSIQVAARASGLSQDVLRAWEKRYGAVEPGRTSGGQRLYSDLDLERLRLLGRVVSGGRRISEVASLDEESLTVLAFEDSMAGSDSGSSPTIDPVASLDAMDAVVRLDAERLREILQAQLLAGGVRALIEELVAPLMLEVGRRWHAGELASSHEHLATEVLRGMVAKILAETKPSSPRGTIVVATASGQRHEVGALMAAAVAVQEGWRVVYLGADLPAVDIVDACEKVGAQALALSHAFGSDTVDDLAELRSVATGLGRATQLLVGGAAAQPLASELGAVGATVVTTLAEFQTWLATGMEVSRERF